MSLRRAKDPGAQKTGPVGGPITSGRAIKKRRALPGAHRLAGKSVEKQRGNCDVFCGVAHRQENELIFARKRENKIWALLAQKT